MAFAFPRTLLNGIVLHHVTRHKQGRPAQSVITGTVQGLEQGIGTVHDDCSGIITQGMGQRFLPTLLNLNEISDGTQGNQVVLTGQFVRGAPALDGVGQGIGLGLEGDDPGIEQTLLLFQGVQFLTSLRFGFLGRFDALGIFLGRLPGLLLQKVQTLSGLVLLLDQPHLLLIEVVRTSLGQIQGRFLLGHHLSQVAQPGITPPSVLSQLGQGLAEGRQLLLLVGPGLHRLVQGDTGIGHLRFLGLSLIFKLLGSFAQYLRVVSRMIDDASLEGARPLVGQGGHRPEPFLKLGQVMPYLIDSLHFRVRSAGDRLSLFDFQLDPGKITLTRGQVLSDTPHLLADRDQPLL